MTSLSFIYQGIFHFCVSGSFIFVAVLSKYLALGSTYPGVVVTLYLMTDEAPFSPPMSSVMGFGVIKRLVKVPAEL